MGAEVNPYLLGAAIYLVLFVVALLFMFALGRVAAKADRDAERLGRGPNARRQAGHEPPDSRSPSRRLAEKTEPSRPNGARRIQTDPGSRAGASGLNPGLSARPIQYVLGHRVQAVDGKAIHSDWFMADLVARTVSDE
jgi:hypothetical protein